MTHFWGEVIGTFILVLLGDCAVGGAVLGKSKAEHSGWIVISTGWGLAAVMAVFVSARLSGAHLNPAVTIALAVIGKFPWSEVPTYIAGQFIGAFLAGVMVWVHFNSHFKETENKDEVLATFSTGPAVKNTLFNFLSEALGSAILLIGILGITSNKLADGVAPIALGMLIWAIVLCLGGATGTAINPARDLAPRIVHALFPIEGKRDSNWGYAWIPVVAPIVGGILGAVIFTALA
jgi:glycerol uptake facilitator protein